MRRSFRGSPQTYIVVGRCVTEAPPRCATPGDTWYPAIVMTLRTLFAVAAMLGALSPALAHAEDVLPDLVREVTTLAARKEYAAAARVAASGAAREDLDHAARGLLGGLAARNFKLAYVR